MKSERHGQTDKLFSIFQAATELAHEQRAAFLDQACAADPELRKEVEALLSYDEKAQSFIESPAFAEATELITADQGKTRVGEPIGPFKLVARLGAGGMGEVYLAVDSRLGRKVALKLLSRSLLGNDQARTRFLREARLASALDHPNICTIHEIGEAAGQLFIAMQYVEGKTLAQTIGGRPLSLNDLLALSLQVADGLAAAHARGIIHRDIKPGNIIITPRGQAKVLDFGLARPVSSDEGQKLELTRSGMVLGTPAYMSPEQARGTRVDRRSDIFSFGALLYEMATGRMPFVGDSQAEVMNAVINQAHTSVLELNKDVLPELAAVIDRALAKEPSNRHQSIEELTSDLRRIATQTGMLGQLLQPTGAPHGLTTIQARAGQNTIITGGWRQTKTPTQRATLALVAGLLLAGLTLLGYFFWSKQSRPAQIKSIAVLPFKPLVAVNRDESLELGMADTLIARLSNLRELEVRPISAVRKYAGLEQDAVTAGREQKVDAVVDGQIQKPGERIRVTVRLVRTADGVTLWASQFDESMTDILRVQDSISERVTGMLALKLSGAEKERMAKHYTEDPAAHQLYLLGRYHLNRLTDEGIRKSLEYFQQALEKDSRFALAHVGVAESYNALGGMNVQRPRDVYPKARAAAESALKLDALLSEAHTALAMVKLAYEWDWAGAERDFKRALEINPNDPEAHFQYSYYLSFMGRFDEGIAEMRRAKELDPVSLVKITGVGQALFVARRYDEAIEQCRTALELDPNLGFTHWLLGIAHMQKGMYEPAILELQKSIPLSGESPDEPASLALAYALSGKIGEARKLLAELQQQTKRKYISPSSLANLYAALGEKEQAFALLDQAYDERDNMMVLLKVEPTFDSLRPDPRFAALLRRVGFTQ